MVLVQSLKGSTILSRSSKTVFRSCDCVIVQKKTRDIQHSVYLISCHKHVLE